MGTNEGTRDSKVRRLLVLDKDAQILLALNAIKRNGTSLHVIPGVVTHQITSVGNICQNIQLLTQEAIVPPGSERTLLDEESMQRILGGINDHRYDGIVLGHMNGDGQKLAKAMSKVATHMTLVRVHNRSVEDIYKSLGYEQVATFIVNDAFMVAVKNLVNWPM